MNKYYYQFSHDDEQIYEFTKLIPDPNNEGEYLRMDKHMDTIRQASQYESPEELERTFEDDFNSFKLQLTYD